MADTISVRFDKELQSDLSKIEREWRADRSEVIRRLLSNAIKAWKFENCIEEIKAHRMSVGKAAEECGVSLWVILELLKDKNIDWVGYDKEDLSRDLGLIE